jgi:uncharacterized membrane protein YecN with MAPEG domain
MENPAVSALALWTGMHLLLMLVLALNVSRLRIKGMKSPVPEETLHNAIRAHGNNIEYVPSALIAMGVLTWLGYSVTWIHGIGGALFVFRLLHAYGIQQVARRAPPPARVLGNLGTWGVFITVSVVLIAQYF